MGLEHGAKQMEVGGIGEQALMNARIVGELSVCAAPHLSVRRANGWVGRIDRIDWPKLDRFLRERAWPQLLGNQITEFLRQL